MLVDGGPERPCRRRHPASRPESRSPNAQTCWRSAAAIAVTPSPPATFCHVAPPSVVAQTPLSPPIQPSGVAEAHGVSQLSSSPSTRVQVLPPSLVRSTQPPGAPVPVVADADRPPVWRRGTAGRSCPGAPAGSFSLVQVKPPLVVAKIAPLAHSPPAGSCRSPSRWRHRNWTACSAAALATYRGIQVTPPSVVRSRQVAAPVPKGNGSLLIAQPVS